MAIRAVRQNTKVAFFQAGDMTEAQQLKRICSYLTKKPTQEKYCGEVFIPVVDCLRNQLDLCNKEERECEFGVFPQHSKLTETDIRKEITMDHLKEAFLDEPDYRPCRNCSEFHKLPLGTPWIKKIQVKYPVRMKEGQKKVDEFFIQHKRRIQLSTHSNGSLSIEKIIMILDRWEREDGFIPGVILIDYADLLTTSKTKEFRHQQNQIWKDARGLSQERNALVIMPTQSDAQSYKQNTLSLSNFSEDKRKYGHVTGMYGLNQDTKGREKKIGLMRINELVVRGGDFDINSGVTVLQRLNLGRPFLGSYF